MNTINQESNPSYLLPPVYNSLIPYELPPADTPPPSYSSLPKTNRTYTSINGTNPSDPKTTSTWRRICNIVSSAFNKITQVFSSTKQDSASLAALRPHQENELPLLLTNCRTFGERMDRLIKVLELDERRQNHESISRATIREIITFRATIDALDEAQRTLILGSKVNDSFICWKTLEWCLECLDGVSNGDDDFEDFLGGSEGLIRDLKQILIHNKKVFNQIQLNDQQRSPVLQIFNDREFPQS